MPFSIAYSKLKTFVNGGKIFPSDVDDALDDLGNQIASVNVAGGFNEGPNVRRGKCIVPGAETRTNTAYGLMPTPDRVQNVTLPASSVLVVRYSAIWQSSVAGAGSAAIFIGSNQLKAILSNSATVPTVQETFSPVSSGVDGKLSSYAQGLISNSPTSSYTDVSTGLARGQLFGSDSYDGTCEIEGLPAGTYTISVQFKASSGNVTAKSRMLLVSAESFS